MGQREITLDSGFSPHFLPQETERGRTFHTKYTPRPDSVSTTISAQNLQTSTMYHQINIRLPAFGGRRVCAQRKDGSDWKSSVTLMNPDIWGKRFHIKNSCGYG